MAKSILSETVYNWLCAWCISRNLPLPTTYKSGFKVDVGYEHQKERYVFPVLNHDFWELANEITEPWIHLKFCGPAEDLVKKLSPKWGYNHQVI